jgi:hypothetical protein
VKPVWNTASALPRLILCIISPRIADDEHLVVFDAHRTFRPLYERAGISSWSSLEL